MGAPMITEIQTYRLIPMRTLNTNLYFSEMISAVEFFNTIFNQRISHLGGYEEPGYAALRRRRATKARPTTVPRSVRLAGSGTGAVTSTVNVSAVAPEPKV
jgi:hypothetical protein